MRNPLTRELTLSALMCALIAVCAQVIIPLPPVPISLSLLAVYIAGALLGPVWGGAAAGSYALLGAAGMPVFAGFSGGASALLGPTGGFILGYVLCAFVSGAVIRRFGMSRRTLWAALIAGTVCCYLSGMLWFCAVTGSTLPAAFSACILPFLPGDALKIALAVSLCLRLHKPLRAMMLL